MRKVLFLLLLLVILGVASVSAQVRIGGDGEPNAAAVLDLNADDDTDTGTKGLALPRVELADSTATLDGTTANTNGMMVYNTGGTLTAGVYYWDGSEWMNVSAGSYVEDATASGGLVRAGSGTAADPYTLGIADGGIVTALVNDGAITMKKSALSYSLGALATNVASAVNQLFVYTPPTGCSYGNSWWQTETNGYISCDWYGNQVQCYNRVATASLTINLWFFCFR